MEMISNFIGSAIIGPKPLDTWMQIPEVGHMYRSWHFTSVSQGGEEV